MDKEQKKELFLETMRFRHACKLFDETKSIPKEDFDFILECGRLSPSSFGMEPWRFLRVVDKNLKEALKPICWDQKQITTCSELVVALNLKEQLLPSQSYPRNMLGRRVKEQEKLDAYMTRYSGFMADKLDDFALSSWSAKQCYIASANMMSGAALIGIDSCPIEGFEKESVQKLLGIDTKKEEVALLLCFGYRVHEQQPAKRLATGEITRCL